MSNIILPFFEEEVYIKPPKTLSDLFNQISKSFLLSVDDSKELILTYKVNEKNTLEIKDENDYKSFLDKKISKIYLDISQDSIIYKNELKEQEEIEKNKKKLENLINLEKELEKSEKEKIEEMNNLINKFGCNANALIKNIHSIHDGNNYQKQKIRKEISELKKKMGLPEKYGESVPMKLKAKPKNEKKEEKKEIKNKYVHRDFICDGCDADPIIGIRYNCAVCADFDYCEKCEKKFGEKHGHPFLKIRNPDDTPLYFNCKLKKNN